MISEIVLLIVGIAVLVGQYLVGLHKEGESKRTEGELRNSIDVSDRQIKQDSLEIKGLKDKVQEKEEQIADLQRKSNLIHAMSLKVLLDLSTPSKSVSDAAPSMGLSSCVALFEKDGTRYRFCSDGKFDEQQYKPDRLRISFVLSPEDFRQFGGNPINQLTKIESLGVNFSEFLKIIQYLPGNGDDFLSLIVVLNGVEVAKVDGKVGGPGSLAAGQRSFQVAAQFKGIPESYELKISERTK